MKRLFFILLLVWGGSLASFAESKGVFFPGEVSEYKVRWAGIPVAWSRTTTELITEGDRELIRLRMVSKSYVAYNALYKVDDLTEVIIDPETTLPLRLTVIFNEGGRHKHNYTTFDHKKGKAIYQDRLTKDIKELDIFPDTRDIFTFLYSVRQMGFSELAGDPHKIYIDGNIRDLDFKLKGDAMVKLSGYGKVDCVELEPHAEFDGLFIRSGKIKCYVSKIDRRMVTCINTKVAIGNVSVKLEELSGPGDDFWMTKK